MISHFDTADQAVEKAIKELCKKLEKQNPANPEFATLVEAISKLRASQNAPIINQQ
jgi:hypothetical protein